MHRNALIYQRKFFLETLKTRPPSRQNFSLMISKGISRGFADYRQRSIDFIRIAGEHHIATAPKKDRHRL